MLKDTDTMEGVIGILSDSYGLVFGNKILRITSNDIKQFERYNALSIHLDEGIKKAHSLLNGIPLPQVRNNKY